jgi:hypothetical protein
MIAAGEFVVIWKANSAVLWSATATRAPLPPRGRSSVRMKGVWNAEEPVPWGDGLFLLRGDQMTVTPCACGPFWP